MVTSSDCKIKGILFSDWYVLENVIKAVGESVDLHFMENKESKGTHTWCFRNYDRIIKELPSQQPYEVVIIIPI